MLLLLLLVPFASAQPFFAEGYISISEPPTVISPGIVNLSLGVTLNDGLFYNGLLAIDLVRTDLPYKPRYAREQEWVVREERIPFATGREQAFFDVPLHVPDFAPQGRYRIDIYVREDRSYVGSYIPAMHTPASMQVELAREDSARSVPVIDLLTTRAEDLSGSLGPFVDKESVTLTINLTDGTIPVRTRITACPWDDTSLMIGHPDPGCASYHREAARSPLIFDLALQRPGAYGIRVEALDEKGMVTSVSRLRAVRNGTSPRVQRVEVVDGLEGLTVQSRLLPSADNRPDQEFVYHLAIEGSEWGWEGEWRYAHPPVMGEAERSVVLDAPIGPVHDGPLLLESSILVNGTIVERHSRIVDTCFAENRCC